MELEGVETEDPGARNQSQSGAERALRARAPGLGVQTRCLAIVVWASRGSLGRAEHKEA